MPQQVAAAREAEVEVRDDRRAHAADLRKTRGDSLRWPPLELALLPPQPLHRRLPDLLEGHAARLVAEAGTAALHGGAPGRAPRVRAGEPRRAQYTGPYASAGPYERDDGGRYEVRLEKVPGGLRLAQWSGGAIEKAAPVLRADGPAPMLATTRERSLLPERDQEALERRCPTATVARRAGVSAGRSGDMREELRVEVGRRRDAADRRAGSTGRTRAGSCRRRR